MEEEEQPAVTFSFSPEHDPALRRMKRREQEEQWLVSNVLSSVSIFYKLFSPSFFLLFLTSVNRWLAGGKGSSQSCLSSRLFSFYILSPSFFLRSLYGSWLAAPPPPPLQLRVSQDKTREMLETRGGEWQTTQSDWINEGAVNKIWMTDRTAVESANNAFLNLTQSISLEGYLKIMTHTHTHKRCQSYDF